MRLPQVAAGREWYMHTIYTVRSKDSANRGIGKRSLEYHSMVSMGNDLALTPAEGRGHRSRRSGGAEVPEVADGIGADNNRGTNIMHIALDRTKRRAVGEGELYADRLEPSQLSGDEGEEGMVTVVGALVGMLLTFLLLAILFLVVRSRQKGGKDEGRIGKTELVRGSASMEPIVVAKLADCSESSEV